MHVSLLGVAMPIGEPIEPIVTIANAEDATARTWTIALGFDRVVLVENDCCRLVGEPRVFPTAFAALESLDATQRTALGLDASRFAALALLDTLRSALANDEHSVRDLAVRALRELAAAFGVTAAGEWRIRRPVFDNAQQLARFCDRVVVDFTRAPAEALARLRQLAIAVGAMTRDDSARRNAFASPTSGAAVPLPIEVTHPVHRDTRVRELALVSEDERPDLVFQPVDRYAGPTIVSDPLTAAYDELIHVVQRISSLQCTDASPDVLESEARWLQAIVDDLAGIAQSPPAVIDAWEITTTRHEHPRLTYLGSNPVTDGQEPPPAVLWLDADTIATVRGDRLVTISLATSAVLREYLINYAVVQSCDDTGRYVLVSAEPDEYGGFGIGCLDLHTGEWLDTLPDHIPAITAGYDENGGTTLYEHRREARSRGINALSFARGNRSVLLSQRNDAIDGGGICATSTLLSEVSPVLLDGASKRRAPMLRVDGTLVEASTDDITQLEREMQERWMTRAHHPWPAAIARVDERWRFLVPSLHVADVERTYFQLGFPIDSACWAPDGRRLLVGGDELLVIDVPAGAISWREKDWHAR